jgi:signal transduction histidine kinase
MTDSPWDDPAMTTAPPPARPRESHHPLEVIPYFRRFPCSPARDFIYTFIWSCLFGVAFYLLSAMFRGELLPPRVFGLQVLISNIIGYLIHGLFYLGAALGIDVAARRGGFPGRVAYFSILPLLGVVLGFWVASLFIDAGFREMFTDSGVLLSVVSTSLVVSVVLSLVFFWRERGAVAEAALATERERGSRVEREATLANLRALQAQIEPHFLFNTLANVSSLIDPDPAKARGMLESFIRFLRASLGATRRESTTLAEEGELIGAYLDVLQVRMGARLRYRVDIEPALASFTLAPMLLQPLVENAIRHGLEPTVEGGEVTFRARIDGDFVAIEIADTGIGFAPVTRGGVGLENIRARLKLLYGEGASLAITGNRPSGAVATVRIPR